MMPEEERLKDEICRLGRRIYEKGFVAASDGNLSVRVEPGRFLCTPSGVCKGAMKPADIATVDEAGKQLAGEKPRTSEILLHLEIYRHLPQVNAVAHAHPPHATAYAVAGTAPPVGVLSEVELFLGPVPMVQYHTPGSPELAQAVVPHLKNKANTLLLANHGAVACGGDLQQACFHLETLETYCQVLLLAGRIGGPRTLSAVQIDQLLQA